MKSYRFTVQGKPVGFKRPRWNSGTRTVFNEGPYTAYKRTIQILAKQVFREPLTVNVMVSVDIFIPCRLKKYKRKPNLYLEPKQHRPDIDNVLKSCLDGMNKIAYKDDRQVTSAHVNFHFMHPDHEPHVDVLVTEDPFSYII